MPTDTYVNVDWVNSYNSTSQLTTVMLPGENILIEAQVSDPFGSYDISDATIEVTAPDGTTIVSQTSMNLIATDGSTPSIWKQYDH